MRQDANACGKRLVIGARRVCVGLALLIMGLGDEPLRAATPDLRWVIDRRDLDFGLWLSRLALGPDGAAWIGGGPPVADEQAGRVYARAGDLWRRLPALGAAGARTFVLSADPRGRAWVAAYVPDSARTYAQLDVYRWERAGWQVQTLRPGLWPQAMAWAGPDEAWIAGNRGLFYHLSAGRWRLEALAVEPSRRASMHLHALTMPARNDGWAVGAHGLVARYREGHWRPLAVPAAFEARHLYGVDRTPDGRVWVVGSSGLLASFDGTWRIWPVPVTSALMAIDMMGADDGWAVGDGGTILRFDGHAWTRQFSPTPTLLTDVRLTSPTSGWIAGTGLVLRASTGAAPAFVDVSSEHQVLANRGATQLAWFDADDDGDLDLFSTGRSGVRVLENSAGAWIDHAELARPAVGGAGEARLGGATWGDADGDGRPDVLLLGHPPGLAWLHPGRGALAFAPPEALVADAALGDASTLLLLDLDGDGQQDLLALRPQAGNQAAPPLALFQQDGGGHLRRVAELGVGRGARLVLWGDLDGDLDLDLLLASAGGRTDLLINTGDLRFRAASGSAGLDGDRPGVTMQGALLDLDRDGDLDLLLLADRLHVFRNTGRAHFEPADELFEALDNNSSMASSQMTAGDLDHDGYPEILLTQAQGNAARVCLFARAADGRYRDVAEAAGLRDLAGQAAAFADWDDDGDLDLLVSAERRSFLLVNRQDDERFVKVRLRALGAPRLAIGTQVRLYDAGHLGEPAHLIGYQAVGVGTSAYGLTHLSELIFGVPVGGRYDIEARFLGGRRVLLRDIAAGARVSLREWPWPIEALRALARRARRGVLRSAWHVEGLGLLFALALAAAVRGPLARWSGARRLCPRVGASLALVALYLALAVASVEAAPALRLGAPALGSVAASALLLAGDRAWTRWRQARYLGPYRLLSVLGEGGMGIVYRARHVVTRRQVALKALHPRAIAEQEPRLRFLREGTIATQLEHPNIVRVFETGEVAGRGFISMELLRGVSLGQWLRRHGPLPAHSAAAALAVAAEALAYVHARGIVHRDVKTDNLFLLDEQSALPTDIAGWRRRLKLTDFGLAYSREMASLTAGRGLLGTLAYLAPEQLRGQPAEAGSDVYALGVVGHELVTGRLRTDTPGPGPRCPPEWLALLERVSGPEPGARPPASEVARAFAQLARGQVPVLLGAAPVSDDGVGPGQDVAWRAALDELHACLAQRRLTEAQVLLVELLGEVRRQLQSLPPDERDDYARRHALHELLALERDLS
jgi:tRNA A-37 threonylcarbamoyl transferase component Bud32